MENTIFRTWLNWPEEGPDTEVNKLPSETQPDMVMSLEDMLVRARNGQEIVQFNTFYDDDEEDFTPDPRSLDMVDYENLISENKSRIETLKEQAKPKEKPKASTPKQQSDEGATREDEVSQADD